MLKKWPVILVFLIPCTFVYSQTTPADTSLSKYTDEILADTTIDYDDLFQDFEAFMDSILTPQSYFMPSLSIGRGYFNFTSKQSELLETTPRLTYSPMMTWYHKGGLGLTLTGYMVHDQQNLNVYQFSITPSFDYLQNRDE